MFNTLASTGASELLGTLRDAIEQRKYHTPEDRLLRNYLLGKYTSPGEFIAAVAQLGKRAEFNFYQLTSRDSIRTFLLTKVAMTPSNLLEVAANGNGKKTHALKGNIDPSVEYSWSVSGKVRNKRQHALTGNTSSNPDFVPFSKSGDILEKSVKYLSDILYNAQPSVS